MVRLEFVVEDDRYEIYNQDQDLIGYVERIRVGRWMHWCLCSCGADVYFSNGCLREIVAFIAKLERPKKKQEVK